MPRATTRFFFKLVHPSPQVNNGWESPITNGLVQSWTWPWTWSLVASDWIITRAFGRITVILCRNWDILRAILFFFLYSNFVANSYLGFLDSVILSTGKMLRKGFHLGIIKSRESVCTCYDLQNPPSRPSTAQSPESGLQTYQTVLHSHDTRSKTWSLY